MFGWAECDLFAGICSANRDYYIVAAFCVGKTLNKPGVEPEEV